MSRRGASVLLLYDLFNRKQVCGSGDYSPGMIASEGQTSAQVPHSMQVSGSMW